MGYIKFEDKIDVIDEQLAKRRSSWKLSSINHVDWDDVQQIIRLHILKKWDQWDQTRPIEPWLNKLITNQIKNQFRNLYYSFARPCLGQGGKPCAANQGGDLCAITPSGKQCGECALYARWEKTKKRAHDVKLPVNLDDNESHIHDTPQFINYSEKIGEIHEKMEDALSPNQFKIYRMLYIEHKPEEEVVAEMGYVIKPPKGRKKARYKQLELYKKHFVETARTIIKNS